MTDTLATFIGILFGAIGTYLGVRSYQRQLKEQFERRIADQQKLQSDAQVKEYAAQRDFQHIRNHLEQLTKNLESLLRYQEQEFNQQAKEVDSRFDALHRELLEVKSMFFSQIRRDINVDGT